MKTHFLTLASAILLTLPAAAQTNAAPGSSKPDSSKPKETRPNGLGGADLFKAADSNADGFIDREEYQRHQASHSGDAQSPTGTADVSTVSAISFDTLDANGDGKLSPKEFAHAGAGEWRSDKTNGSAPGAKKGSVIEGAR